MKPLYKLSSQNKSTYFSLCIGKIGQEITKRCDEWFTQVFLEKSIPVTEDILTDNLLLDLNYLFSEAIWLIKLAKKENLDVKDSNRHLQFLYDRYSGKDKLGPNGYRRLVSDKRYNSREHRLWTETEIKNNEKRNNAIMKKLWNEIELEKNK